MAVRAQGVFDKDTTCCSAAELWTRCAASLGN